MTPILILCNLIVFSAMTCFIAVFMSAGKEAKPERTIKQIKDAHKKPGKPWTLKDEREDAAAFMADRTLFWLDPNRYGDDPDWQTRLFPTPPPVREPEQIANMQARYRPGSVYDYMLTEEEWEAKYRITSILPPRCPRCGETPTSVEQEHGGEATAWRCEPCLISYTKAGETKASKRERKLRQSTDIADRYRAKGKKLPCGCKGAISFSQDHEGYKFSVCDTCGADWYARSNDPSGRTLAQGEKVYRSNEVAPPLPPASTVAHADFEKGLRREAAWQRVIASGGNDGAGSCPDHDGCGWPVLKRKDAKYICTNTNCKHSKTPWC